MENKYPIPAEAMRDRLINKNYRGYALKKSVEDHLKEFRKSIDRSIKICGAKDSDYWKEVLKLVKETKIEPHKCNLDYLYYCLSKLSIPEIVEQYDNITIKDIKESLNYDTERIDDLIKSLNDM